MSDELSEFLQCGATIIDGHCVLAINHIGNHKNAKGASWMTAFNTCGSPGEGYNECWRRLGHKGKHAWHGKLWGESYTPELDPDVEEMLDGILAKHPSRWIEDEWPIIVRRTSVYVAWIGARDQDEALRYARGSAWEMDLTGDDALHEYFDEEVTRPDKDELEAAWRNKTGDTLVEFGPKNRCSDCGAIAVGIMPDSFAHDPLGKCYGQWKFREAYNGRMVRSIYG